MAFQPNIRCTVIVPGLFDKHGRQQIGERIDVECGIVKLDLASARTAIRTDASGSHAAAREVGTKAVLLFLPTLRITLEWLVEIYGFTLRVTSVFPRYNVAGVLDHLEVGLDVWEDKAHAT